MGLGWSKGPQLPDTHDGDIHEAPELPRGVDIEQPDQADPVDQRRSPVVGVALAIAVFVAAVIINILANGG